VGNVLLSVQKGQVVRTSPVPWKSARQIRFS